MILFKKQHVQPILDGIKTATRRLGKKRWDVGSVHHLKTGFKKDDTFAMATIKAVYRQRLCDMTDNDVLQEGYITNPEGFFKVFTDINKIAKLDQSLEVWVVEFEVVD